MKNKLIFLDIDGTLTDPGSNVPPKSAIEAIKKARKNGHKIFLCTGRNYDMLSPLLQYEFDGVIGSAGGYVTCGEEVIFDCPMKENQREQALSVLKNNGVIRTIECFDGSYIDNGFEKLLNQQGKANSELLRWRKQIEKSLNIQPIDNYHGQPVYKIVFMCTDLKQLDEPRKLLEKDFMFVIQEANEHGIINGEVVNRRFDKGQGVRRVCERLGIETSDTIGFGDSMNDLEMFEAVNYSVCMENGNEILKKKADYICPSVNDDGIKRAFEKLNLLV